MRFRKPWLRVRAVNFDFSAKSSHNDYNKSNKWTSKFPAHIESKKLLVEFGVLRIEIFHFSIFFALLKGLLFPSTMCSLKLSITDYNESNKPNLKSLAYLGVQEIACRTWSSKKCAFPLFFTFFPLLKSLLFHPKPWFPKMHHIYKNW